MKLIPPEISMRNPSAAEKKVFGLLSDVKIPGYTALHSLNLSEHEYKQCAEIDFLLIGPRCLLVLEVKGGRVSCANGVWTFTDRYDRQRRKTEGPFDQARSAAFALRDRLGRLLPAGTLTNARFGWGVVLPDEVFTVQSVEWAPEMVLDGPDCSSPLSLERSIEKLLRYWERKKESRRALNDAELELIRRAVRPDFDLVPSLRLRGENIESKLSSLTTEQYHLLDLVENERILCQGGAGTGKTFLAAEVARREVAHGRRVLLTCRSQILVNFLRDQPGLDNPRCEIAPVRTIKDCDNEMFDLVVVDEGQDVINGDDLASIDSVLTGGLATGMWRIFLDANAQADVLGQFDTAALEMLVETSPARLHLRDNCRNTREIVTQVQLVTGADIGASTAGTGLDVQYYLWGTQEDQATALAKVLEEALLDGIDPGYMTILSPGNVEASCIRFLPRRIIDLISPLDSNNVLRPHPGRIGHSAVRDFKGLENRFVYVTDLCDIDATLEAANTIYVAMTRAKAGLWLGFRADLAQHLEELGRAHAAEQ